jgi:hypothetical protein
MLVRPWFRRIAPKVHPLRLGLETLSVAWALWPISVLLYVFCARVSYPMDLEWCEGGLLYQAYRLLHGLPIYVRGDPTWEPWLYPIGHTVALAAAGIFHIDYWTGRLVSIFFFCVMCVTLFREIYRHIGKSTFAIAAGALAVASIACGFPVVGQWYDLIRVDTMMLALSIIGVARVGQPGASLGRTTVTALVLSASILTKQTAAFFVAWTCLFAIVREPRVGLRLATMTLLMTVVALALLQWGTHGSYWFFTVTDPQKQHIRDAAFADGLRLVWHFAPFIALLPLGCLLLALRGWLGHRSILWMGSLIVAVPASLLPYAKEGGYINNLMPMVVLAGPVTVLLLADVAKRRGAVGAIARWGLMAGFGLFIWVRALHPSAYIPDKSLRQAAKELNTLVASLGGGVVVPELTFLPAHNGHTNLHWTAMSIISADWSKRPMDEVAGLEKSGARWVILQSQDNTGFAAYVRSRFEFAGNIPISAQVRMMTGQDLRLDELWQKPQAEQ